MLGPTACIVHVQLNQLNVVQSCLKSSYLWRDFSILPLTQIFDFEAVRQEAYSLSLN
jgi:hypothetical protein